MLRRKRTDDESRAYDTLATLVCCNADGSEKYRPMFIGDVEDSCASVNPKLRLHFDYHSNCRGQITCHPFIEWLQRFDAYAGLTPGRKAVLLLSNGTVHGAMQTLPKLQHVNVTHLPLNDTALRLHPCIAEAIALIKTQYRAFQLERALDLFEEDSNKVVHDIDILTTMRRLKMKIVVSRTLVTTHWCSQSLKLKTTDKNPLGTTRSLSHHIAGNWKAIAIVIRLACGHNVDESFSSQLAELQTIIRSQNNTSSR